jgi:hypothetical protein
VRLSLEEVKEREAQAKQAHKMNSVLQQWYYCLGQALEQSEGLEPDFSFDKFADCYWIGKHDQTFIESVIGDQLKEYGLVLTTFNVDGFDDSAVWVCIGKPGQFDQYLRH